MASHESKTGSGVLPIDKAPISWLSTPPSSRIEEPVHTLAQVLPLDQLTWEDFERLCLRLVQRDENVEYCQLYGTRGQDQQGIDLYARKSGASKYTVYQCKRVKHFGPASIRQAVDEFIDEEWAKRTDTFVLCTSESLIPSDCANAVREQGERLTKVGISFVPWGVDRISEKLKPQSDLVHDFFGTGWVKLFCGEKEAEQLSNRLQPQDLIALRARLAQCYKRIFDAHDPGLPGDTSGQGRPLALKARFVLPDINLPASSSIGFPGIQGNETDGEAVDEYARASTSAIIQGIPKENTPHRSSNIVRRPQTVRHHGRQMVSDWLNASRRHVVLGLPGTGKSSLLRFIALDLLDDAPCLDSFARQWGQYLPIWVPFALWTKLIHDTPGVPPPLHELLQKWFSMWGEEALWPLVSKGLEDGRLLLLVDGLDEWTSEAAARLALDQMRVFVEQHDIPAIASSRPHGFRQLGAQSLAWQIGEISGLSRDQQLKLGTIWFADRLRYVENTEAGSDENDLARRGRADAEQFLSDLERSPDLKDLAEIPLLFLLLVVLKLGNVDLPRSRFDAYKRLIEHLSRVHPRGRQKAASIAADELLPLSDNDFGAVVEKLAYELHSGNRGGQISTSDATDILIAYLKDEEEGLGYEHRIAREMAGNILTSCTDAVGLLVRRSDNELAFFHRSFEEFLASSYLASKPHSKRIEFVRQHCEDAVWREVLLGLFYVTRVHEEIKDYLEVIENVRLLPHERQAANLLLYEVAFGDYRCPQQTIQRIIASAFQDIEHGNWMPHRQRVLRLMLGGLRSTRVQVQVQAKVKQWLPARSEWRSDLYHAIGTWKPTQETIECLWMAIKDDSVSNQRAASKALIAHAGTDRMVLEQAVAFISSSAEPKMRAAVLFALIEAGQDFPRMEELIAEARNSASPELRLTAIFSKIKSQTQTEQDCRAALRCVEFFGGIDYYWKDEIAKVLADGWSDSERLLKMCLRSVGESRNMQTIDYGVATMVMLTGYPQHPQVAGFIDRELSRSHGHLIVDHRDAAWKLVQQNFKDNPIVVAAIDRWLPTQQYFDPSSMLSVLVGCTEVGKKYLLNSVDQGVNLYFSIPLLLEAWGIADPDVAAAATQIAWGPADKASWIGHHLSRIIPDIDECRKRMLTILRDSACQRLDIMLSALAEIGTEQDKSEAVSIVLSKLEHNDPAHSFNGSYGLHDPAYLFSEYATDERVREVVRATLASPDCNWPAIARFFSDDPQMHRAVLEISRSLPAALRQTIAEYLADGRSGDTEFALSLLRDCNVDPDAEVKVRASLGYHQMLMRRHEVTEEAIQTLKRNIVAYGPWLSMTRQAAFAGIMVLRQYDIVLDARETREFSDNPENYVDLRLGWMGSDKLTAALGEFMMLHWEEMRDAMKERFQPFLSSKHHRFEGSRFWSALCPFADAAENPREEVLAGLEATYPRYADQDVLVFLSRVKPGSSLLLEYCMAALREARGKNYVFVPEALTAIEVIGTQFERDNRAMDALTESLKTHSQIEEAEATALCAVSAPDDQLRLAWEVLWNHRSYLFFNTDFYFACRLASTPEIKKMLQRYLFRIERRGREIMPIARPLIARMRQKPELIDRLWNRLTSETATASEKASFPKLLATVTGMTPQLREWCSAELERQLDPSQFSAVGVDIVIREVRPVAWSLLDLLS